MAKREKIIVNNDSNASADEEKLTVVSYNVLADCHVDHDMDTLYTKCQPRDLYIGGRFDAIAAEVAAYEPDVVCFQEVPPDYYQRNFKPHFEKLGFEGVYMKRIADTHHEGEATFYRSSKLELVRSVSKSLVDLIRERVPADVSMPSSVWDYLQRPDVTVICHFKSRDSGREFVVANAHISFVGYKLRDLQALQTTTVMKALTDLAKNGDSFLPHIIAGDFNQQPESPGYQILLRGVPSEEALDELKRQRHIVDAKSEVEANSKAPPMEGESAKTGLFHLLGADYFRHVSDGLKSAYLEGLKGNEPRVTCIDLEQDNS